MRANFLPRSAVSARPQSTSLRVSADTTIRVGGVALTRAQDVLLAVYGIRDRANMAQMSHAG